MTLQIAGNRLAPLPRSTSHSSKRGAAAAILAVTSVAAVVVGLILLAQLYVGVGAAPPGFEDNGAWIVGP
ncbi:MAG TPA: hypothetical protein VKX28_24945 [Xanthobacteraceae bacterium]|nr:hypothetical protein [Xanthobacteraceae bacterium]